MKGAPSANNLNYTSFRVSNWEIIAAVGPSSDDISNWAKGEQFVASTATTSAFEDKMDEAQSKATAKKGLESLGDLSKTTITKVEQVRAHFPQNSVMVL